MSVPIRPTAPRAGRKFRFPAQSPVSLLKYHLAPVTHSWTPPFCVFVWETPWQKKKVNNSIAGVTAKFSRPKWRKIDHGGERLKAPPEG
jgi:hypothetical protein